MYSPSRSIVTLATKLPVNLREAVTRGDAPSRLSTLTAGEGRKGSGRFKQLLGFCQIPAYIHLGVVLWLVVVRA